MRAALPIGMITALALTATLAGIAEGTRHMTPHGATLGRSPRRAVGGARGSRRVYEPASPRPVDADPPTRCTVIGVPAEPMPVTSPLDSVIVSMRIDCGGGDTAIKSATVRAANETLAGLLRADVTVEEGGGMLNGSVAATIGVFGYDEDSEVVAGRDTPYGVDVEIQIIDDLAGDVYRSTITVMPDYDGALTFPTDVLVPDGFSRLSSDELSAPILAASDKNGPVQVSITKEWGPSLEASNINGPLPIVPEYESMFDVSSLRIFNMSDMSVQTIEEPLKNPHLVPPGMAMSLDTTSTRLVVIVTDDLARPGNADVEVSFALSLKDKMVNHLPRFFAAKAFAGEPPKIAPCALDNSTAVTATVLWSDVVPFEATASCQPGSYIRSVKYFSAVGDIRARTLQQDLGSAFAGTFSLAYDRSPAEFVVQLMDNTGATLQRTLKLMLPSNAPPPPPRAQFSPGTGYGILQNSKGDALNRAKVISDTIKVPVSIQIPEGQGVDPSTHVVLSKFSLFYSRSESDRVFQDADFSGSEFADSPDGLSWSTDGATAITVEIDPAQLKVLSYAGGIHPKNALYVRRVLLEFTIQAWDSKYEPMYTAFKIPASDASPTASAKPSKTPSGPNGRPGSNGVSPGVVAGAVVGSLAGIALIAGILVVVQRRRAANLDMVVSNPGSSGGGYGALADSGRV